MLANKMSGLLLILVIPGCAPKVNYIKAIETPSEIVRQVKDNVAAPPRIRMGEPIGIEAPICVAHYRTPGTSTPIQTYNYSTKTYTTTYMYTPGIDICNRWTNPRYRDANGAPYSEQQLAKALLPIRQHLDTQLPGVLEHNKRLFEEANNTFKRRLVTGTIVSTLIGAGLVVAGTQVEQEAAKISLLSVGASTAVVALCVGIPLTVGLKPEREPFFVNNVYLQARMWNEAVGAPRRD
jgi:hypothetical protein